MPFNPAPKPQKAEKKAKKRIAPSTPKEEDEIYSYLASWFKRENKVCECCNVKASDDVHHSAGRGQGFKDKWAELMGVSITLDIRYWIALCRPCHTKVETNPEWAKEKGLSVNRIRK